MGVKAEITWKLKDPEGGRREVNVRHVGSRWLFFHRERRFDTWEPLPNPSLADWQELLDAVERRIARRLLRPEEAERVRVSMREAFPEAEA